LVYKATHAVTANTYDAVIGPGGAAKTSTGTGNVGTDSTFTINGGAQRFTGKGGGGGGSGDAYDGGDGGSGGGSGHDAAGAGDEIQSSQSGDSDVGAYGFGNDGGEGTAATGYNLGGGGGAGSAGAKATSSVSGNGGTGKDYSAIFGTAVGESGWFASGGGGGYSTDGGSQAGTASNGGGSDGGPNAGSSSAAQANTGGGSGGGSQGVSAGSGAGGSGVILVRYANADFPATYNDIILQSTDTAAEAAPTKADMVMLMEDAAGTATLNTDIKGYVSRDSGVTFTEGVLVDEGDWGTNKRILAFHDLSFTSSSGTAMCYKITTHNQVVGKQTKIHATSIGWR
jgi:hypothetical protein